MLFDAVPNIEIHLYGSGVHGAGEGIPLSGEQMMMMLQHQILLDTALPASQPMLSTLSSLCRCAG
jgi:hypothetical protein